ncbi:hypothetical protein QFZ24_001531 [Streptomyces phaeochromogenes]|uniref:hypothetical protein n=1 Tax=Streptomyces phaeochromogenes TaxID=1923 RepID=UPI0027943D29|nr:hypothetical protein [Streptomyces phaeochromogenes]MDQ0947608.1 hypothetical protein [Streptomyces phaeochromogenes]
MTKKTSTAHAVLPVDVVVAAARELARAGRWQSALDLLDRAVTDEPHDRAVLALAGAEVALEHDWFGGTDTVDLRIAAADRILDELTGPVGLWDLDFVRLRHTYFRLLRGDGTFRFGPAGKDPAELAELRRGAQELCERADDEVRRGWARMYLGLIVDNLFAERDAAPAHYELALGAGESGDDLLAREALRHLGDHDHDDLDHARARERWTRATALGARAGNVPGTLSQQLLLAVLARGRGDEAGAAALATEVARWAGAIGAVRIEAQATGFLAGVDPTAGPEDES